MTKILLLLLYFFAGYQALKIDVYKYLQGQIWEKVLFYQYILKSLILELKLELITNSAKVNQHLQAQATDPFSPLSDFKKN